MKNLNHAIRGEHAKIFPTENSLASKAAYEKYVEIELRQAATSLRNLGYDLKAEQVHIGGERYVMSGRKLVLLGTRLTDGQAVVIKFSTHQSGREEINHEHQVDQTLRHLNFSAHTFAVPAEYWHQNTSEATIRIVEYLEEDQTFASLPAKEQFFVALKSFQVQAGLHATTYGHIKDVRGIFGLVSAKDYHHLTTTYRDFVAQRSPLPEVTATVERATAVFNGELPLVDMYCGFLTHTDFAPHNVRLRHGNLYLIDQTSLHFGNKHESWARFINYMILYNQTLAEYLVKYVKDNRAETEYRSLRLLQLYKLIYLLAFYVSSYERSQGDHQALSIARLRFWNQVLNDVLADNSTDPLVISQYKETRDTLRDEAEKNRQRVLGQL